LITWFDARLLFWLLTNIDELLNGFFLWFFYFANPECLQFISLHVLLRVWIWKKTSNLGEQRELSQLCSIYCFVFFLQTINGRLNSILLKTCVLGQWFLYSDISWNTSNILWNLWRWVLLGPEESVNMKLGWRAYVVLNPVNNIIIIVWALTWFSCVLMHFVFLCSFMILYSCYSISTYLVM